MTSHSFFCSHPSTLLNLQSSKSKPIFLLPQTPISRTSLKTTPFGAINFSASDSSSTTVFDNPISNSSTDQSSDELAAARIGATVKVKVPLKVYHIPKVPEFDLEGKIGTLKQYLVVYKGKPISANYPYKVEFKEDGIEGRDGPVKFSTHLREDEFDYID